MDSLKDKRACTSYRIMVSVDQVKRYKKVTGKRWELERKYLLLYVW